jgi:hypothetical protein
MHAGSVGKLHRRRPIGMFIWLRVLRFRMRKLPRDLIAMTLRMCEAYVAPILVVRDVRMETRRIDVDALAA